jgi:four helix bundle protein
MKEKNVIVEKSYVFALRIVKLFRYLSTEKKEYHLSKQLIRSGTSIGANVEEAMAGSSRNDFKAKLDIAHKEARETRFWLKLLRDSKILELNAANSILFDCEELIKILSSILKSIKSNPS